MKIELTGAIVECRSFDTSNSASRQYAIRVRTVSPEEADGAFLTRDTDLAISRHHHDEIVSFLKDGGGYTPIRITIETIPPKETT